MPSKSFGYMNFTHSSKSQHILSGPSIAWHIEGILHSTASPLKVHVSTVQCHLAPNVCPSNMPSAPPLGFPQVAGKNASSNWLVRLVNIGPDDNGSVLCSSPHRIRKRACGPREEEEEEQLSETEDRETLGNEKVCGFRKKIKLRVRKCVGVIRDGQSQRMRKNGSRLQEKMEDLQRFK